MTACKRPCYHAWCRGITVSFVQCLDSAMKNAVFPVFLVVLHNKINRDSSDLVFAGSDSLNFIGIHNVGNGFFLLWREAMGRRFFAKCPDSRSDRFNHGVVIPCYRAWLRGVMVSWYHDMFIGVGFYP